MTLVLLSAIACGPSAGPAPVTFSRVELPPGAVPEVLVAAGRDVLIGVRHDGQPSRPGLVRLGPDGSATELTVAPTTGYGSTASWFSLASDGRQVVGIGGDRGGAHSNVRWSVWTGSGAGVREQQQTFNTFGGWGAGELIDSVLTPAGPVVVGSWQSAEAGLDVAVWTPDGDTWVRRDSTGTALANTRAVLGFPIHATTLRQGIVVVGWQLAGTTGGPAPVAWQSTSGPEQWTRTPLPDSGTSGAAAAIRCADDSCAVSGRVDGALALWRLTGGTWTRVTGMPAIPVGDRDPLPAPLNLPRSLAQIVSDGPQIKVLTVDGATGTVHPVEGPTGAAVSAVEAGGAIYLLAGPDPRTLQLWRADAATLS